LDILIAQLRSSPLCGKIILAIGYMAKQVRSRYKQPSIIFSEENMPLGTGGALKKAALLSGTDRVLALNGDSYLNFDLPAMLQNHLENNADMTIAYTGIQKADRYGALTVDEKTNRITAFLEKKFQESGRINGGIYLFNKGLMENQPFTGTFSLETDLFPFLLNKRLFGYPCSGAFIDIGTQESYQRAQQLLKHLTKSLS